MLMPKRQKHRKQQKGSLAGNSKGGNFVAFGDFGMQALERGRITARQIESARVAINRHFQRRGKVWIKIFPDVPRTAKPLEVRMGKGKGGVDHYIAVVRPGRILFEVTDVTEDQARYALGLAAAKLGIRTRFVKRVEEV